MGEVGHTQLGEDGRLHTVIADPHELPGAAPAAPVGPQIPAAPRGGRRKSSPLPMILGGVVLLAAIAVPVTIYALGGFDEEEKKPKKTAAARPAPAPAPTPTPTPTPTPAPPRPPPQQPQQKPQQQPPPQQQPQSEPSGSSSGGKKPAPPIPSGLATSNPLATPWSR